MVMARARLAAFTTVLTLAYLGLAIAGWGSPAAFFAHPPLIALSVAVLALSAAALFTQGNLSPGIREDRGNRWVIAVFALIGLAEGFLPAYADRLDILTFGGQTVRWAGVALFLAGGALRMAPVFVLGRRFSGLVAIQSDHVLATGGLYATIRNPSYLGLVINSLGWALAFRSGVGLALTALLAPPLVARMNAEEALLAEHFGDAYQAYRARTWRLIPFLY
jgi:protein-S-isoprenylcysteine O-methyltransferase Ste14